VAASENKKIDVEEDPLNQNQRRLNEEGQNQWNEKASFWDALHGADGNDFHRHLVSPAVERLLDLCLRHFLKDIMLTKRISGLFCLLSLLWLTACRNIRTPFFPAAELSIQLDQ
jgi:hypothetical protein